jgi:heptosyltransferase-1
LKPGHPPKNILIIRISAIGDVIMASALIPALREAYPEARINWLVDEAIGGLLTGNPRLHRVIVWPRRHWRELLRKGRYLEWCGELKRLLTALRKEHFDLVLDTQGLLKSGIWAFLSGGGTRIGLGSREGSQWLMHKVIDRKTEHLLVGSEYLKLMRSLGFEPAHFDMDIAVSGQVGKECAALLKLAGVDKPFAVICPFTTRPQKHWFDDRWVELSTRLADARGLQVVMLGGPADGKAAQAVAAGNAALVSLVGRTSLGQCAAIIASAELLIGVDTGLTHLGIAMKTPTLALFGPTRPYLDIGTAKAKILYERIDCSPCHRRPTCGGEFTCMKLHTVDKVLSASAELLGKR